LLGLVPFITFFSVLPLVLLKFKVVERAFHPWITGISSLSIPMLPMSYIYAIYKHHLGTLEFRANRLIGAYGFSALSILSFATVLLLAATHWAPVNVQFLLTIIAVSVFFAVPTPILRHRFQILVDRHVFGIRHIPEEVIGIVSERIPTAFDRTV